MGSFHVDDMKTFFDILFKSKNDKKEKELIIFLEGEIKNVIDNKEYEKFKKSFYVNCI